MFNSWLRIIIKKTLNNKAFIAMLFLIPLIVFGVVKINDIESQKKSTKVYLYAREQDEFSDNVISELVGDYEGYSFVEAKSEEQVLDDVKNHRALCGFILEEDQIERIKDGKERGNIIFVMRVGSVNADIIKEMFFSSYYKEYTKYFTINYWGMEDSLEFEENYYSVVENTIFSYSIDELETEDDVSSMLNVKSLLGILVSIFSLLIIADFITDKENGILYPIPPKKRFGFRVLYFATPLMMLAPFVYLGVVFSPNSSGYVKELISIILYILFTLCLSVGLSYVIKKKSIIMGMIPVLTLFYIVVCPVFIDLSVYLPVFNVLKYFCPPYYYML